MQKTVLVVLLSISGILSSVIMGCSSGNASEGAVLFERERCIYCHKFKGRGATIGPDLTDVAKIRSDEWIRDQIRNPRLHYPDGAMPSHEYLSNKEISSLLKYLKS